MLEKNNKVDFTGIKKNIPAKHNSINIIPNKNGFLNLRQCFNFLMKFSNRSYAGIYF